MQKRADIESDSKETVVVLLSAYNGERFIGEQIDSILAQKSVGVRLMVRDDGSRDSTVAIVEKYAKDYPGTVFLMRGENCGFALSFTRLLEEALKAFPEAGYFAFSDQDDIWLPNKLAVAVGRVANEPAAVPVAYCCNTALVDCRLHPIGTGFGISQDDISKPRALVQSFATGCTLVFNRCAAVKYAEHVPGSIRLHDFFMYQICVFLGKLIYDPTPYILYRQHGNNELGNPGFVSRMKKRLKGCYKKGWLETLNRDFYDSFAGELSEADRTLVKRFIGYRSSVRDRLWLLFSPSIRYTDIESDIFFRIKIIIGGV